MIAKEAQKVKIGDQVKWIGDGEPCQGEVIEVGYNAFKVRWTDGVVMILGLNDPDALKEVELVK